MLRNCSLNPDSWLYAIHGRNPEIIYILNENNIKPKDDSYKNCLEFSIRCHHNELVSYFLENYFDQNEISIKEFVFENCLKSYNIEFIQSEMIVSDRFYDLCQYDYYYLAKEILKNDKNIDFNRKIISDSINFDGSVDKIEKTILSSNI